MIIKELDYPSYAASAAPRVSWLAVFAGAATCVAAAGALCLLGIGVGAVRVPATGIAAGITLRATLWLLGSSAAAFYAGGWVCGRVAGLGRPSDSVIHGLAAWAAASTGLLLLFPAAGMVFSPMGVSLSAAAAPAFAWTGFLSAAAGCVACLAGARHGTRLLKPVPVEQYRAAKPKETVQAGR